MPVPSDLGGGTSRSVLGPVQTRKEYMTSEASPFIPKSLLPLTALCSKPSLGSLVHPQASAESSHSIPIANKEGGGHNVHMGLPVGI